MKTWAVRINVELFIDDVVVAKADEMRGAFVEHLPLDRKSLRTETGDMARRAINRIAKTTNLLP